VPKSTQKLVVFPANRGLNTNRNIAQLRPDELVTAKNIVFDTATLARKKRPGLKRFDQGGFTTVNNVRGISDYWRNVSGSQQHQMMAYVDGRVYSISNNGVASDVTGSVTLTATDRVTFNVYDGLLIMTFENTVPYQYTGTGNISALVSGLMADAAAGGNLSLYQTFSGSGWLAGDPTKPHRLFKSAVGDPNTWSLASGGDAFDIDVGDGDPVGITALFPPMFDTLYVAKRKAIYRVYVASDTTFTRNPFGYGSLLFGVKPVVKGIGCISPNTVVPIQNDVIFCSERGVHSLMQTDKLGAIESAFLSEPIHKTFIEELNYQRLDDMWAVYSPDLNSYLLSFPRKGASNVDDLLGYNLINGQWYRWEQYNVAGMCQYIDTDNKTRIAVARSTGRIGLIDDKLFTDIGESVTVLLKTGVIFPMGTPTQTVGFKNLTVTFVPKGNYNFTVAYKVDGLNAGTATFNMNGVGGTALGVFTLGTDELGFRGKVKTITQPISGYGAGIELTFTQTPSIATNYEEDVEILGYAIEIEGTEDTSETIYQG